MIGINISNAPRFEKTVGGLSLSLPSPPAPVKADVLLKEGSELKLGDLVITTLHTPGHTDGSACFHVVTAGALFTGDTPYAGFFGRTEAQGGRTAEMVVIIPRMTEIPA